MLGLFLPRRMTVRIMLASHMKRNVLMPIKQFDLTLTTEVIGHGTVTPFHTCLAMVNKILGFQFPQANIGWNGHMAVRSDHSCIFHYLIVSLSGLPLHLILSHGYNVALAMTQGFSPLNARTAVAFLSFLHGQLILMV